MTLGPDPHDETRPAEQEALPGEEHIDGDDVEERLDTDPDEQRNYTDPAAQPGKSR
jgi:hypothetical protein